MHNYARGNMLNKLKSFFLRKPKRDPYCMHEVIDCSSGHCTECNGFGFQTKVDSKREPITITVLSEEKQREQEELQEQIRRFWAYQMQNAAQMGNAAYRQSYNPFADSLYDAYAKRHYGSIIHSIFNGMF